MDTIRIINFILQSSFLVLSIFLAIKLIKNRNASPVFNWFIYLNISFWLWVSGRFMETILYLFFPGNNDAYVFAANYQYIGLLGAGTVYLIWNIYQTRFGIYLDKKWVKPLIFSGAIFTLIVVFTNSYHHLFYTKLIMGETVAHGPLFAPLMFLGYLTMFAGYIIAIINTIKQREHILLKMFLHTLIAVVPAMAAVVRSLSGVDLFDYTPIVLGASIYSLFLLLFRYKYINITAASIDVIVEQTYHPIAVYDGNISQFIYKNKAARENYDAQLQLIRPLINKEPRFEGEFKGKILQVEASLIEKSKRLLTITDTTELSHEKNRLEDRIRELDDINQELFAQKSNLDAYIESIKTTEGIVQKQQLIEEVRKKSNEAFERISDNLEAAKSENGDAGKLLFENMTVAENCIAEIRAVVHVLKGEDIEYSPRF
ncbi:MAG: hypothetical protein GX663_02790 [Clostridiales bacterium]|nr:hypothetical protein [Clostridiales bacterium]